MVALARRVVTGPFRRVGTWSLRLDLMSAGMKNPVSVMPAQPRISFIENLVKQVVLDAGCDHAQHIYRVAVGDSINVIMH